MPKKFILALAVLALAVTPNLDAQAMIGYGHQVAKAGAIGAAVGSGLAGGLTKVGSTLEGTSSRKRSPLRRVTKSSTMSTGTRSGKIVISGGEFATVEKVDDVATPAEDGAEVLEARAPKAVLTGQEDKAKPVFDTSTQAPSPSRGPAPASANADQDEAIAENAAPELEQPAAPTTEAAGNPELREVANNGTSSEVIAEGLEATEASTGDRAQAPVENTVAAIEAPVPAPAPFTFDQVEIGGSVQSIIGSLGRPSTSIYGLGGINYSEKYFFTMQDGSRMVVLAIDGVITRAGLT